MTSDPVRFDVPLCRYVTLRIGGPAALYAAPADVDGLRGIYALARARGISTYLLGGGSNLLVGDAGLSGLVLHTVRLRSVTRLGERDGRVLVSAGAGMGLSRLVEQCVQWGLSGPGFLAGIPGTVGGAVAMNAGVRECCMGELVHEVTCCDADGRLHTISARDCAFAYRSSAFQEGLNDAVILAVTLALRRGHPERLRREVAERMRRRKKKQPRDYPCAGSIFRNPEGDYAGSLIERAGWKGRREGGALVAPEHANFIVNAGGATARDVATLIRRIRRSVWEEFGVWLELELKTWGVPELC